MPMMGQWKLLGNIIPGKRNNEGLSLSALIAVFLITHRVVITEEAEF